MIRVFKGDNGVQEFWESEHGDMILFRVKRDKWWLYARDSIIQKNDEDEVICDKSLEKLQNKVENKVNQTVIFDGSKSWIKQKDKRKKRMMLRSELC